MFDEFSPDMMITSFMSNFIKKIYLIKNSSQVLHFHNVNPVSLIKKSHSSLISSNIKPTLKILASRQENMNVSGKNVAIELFNQIKGLYYIIEL